jgi:hypothetical protein
MIEIPDRACHDYLRSFGLGCIFVTAGGKIGAGSDLAHADQPVAAWWCNSRRSAEEILTAVNGRYAGIEEATRAVLQAATRLGVVLSGHEAVLARARAAARELDARVSSANAAGTLQFLNQEYRRRRLEAERSGRRFMTYSEAQRRLKAALAGAAAGYAVADLVKQVFNG